MRYQIDDNIELLANKILKETKHTNLVLDDYSTE